MNGVFPIGNTESEYKNKRLRLSQGIKTFCPPTADGGAKAGFKVQRLSQGSGTFCRASRHWAKAFFIAFQTYLGLKTICGQARPKMQL